MARSEAIEIAGLGIRQQYQLPDRTTYAKTFSNFSEDVHREENNL
jgi:hypothetical protein